MIAEFKTIRITHVSISESMFDNFDVIMAIVCAKFVISQDDQQFSNATRKDIERETKISE